ncbi:hypothetical protein GCM10028817_40990 [Spirosoma pomorum]
MREYVHHRDRNAPKIQLNNMVEQLQKKGHPTVWKEMQRYHRLNILSKIDADLDALFNQAPESLSW